MYQVQLVQAVRRMHPDKEDWIRRSVDHPCGETLRKLPEVVSKVVVFPLVGVPDECEGRRGYSFCLDIW